MLRRGPIMAASPVASLRFHQHGRRGHCDAFITSTKPSGPATTVRSANMLPRANSPCCNRITVPPTTPFIAHSRLFHASRFLAHASSRRVALGHQLMLCFVANDSVLDVGACRPVSKCFVVHTAAGRTGVPAARALCTPIVVRSLRRGTIRAAIVEICRPPQTCRRNAASSPSARVYPRARSSSAHPSPAAPPRTLSAR